MYWRQFKRSWQLYLLLAVPLALAVHLPVLPDVRRADRLPRLPAWHSMWAAEWVGWIIFTRFFQSVMFRA